MTEYDYSPDAYQRYMDTQSRVARWVDNTEAHAHQFRAPFGTRSDIDEEDMERDMERDVDGGRYHRPGKYSRRHHDQDNFHEMSAGLSTIGDSTPYSPQPYPSYQAALPQSYPPGPVPQAPVPAQTSYSSLYPSYVPQPQLLRPQMSGYTSPSPLATPPPPIVIQRASKHHSSRHRHDHHHSSSSSRSKSRPRTYVIQPSSAPNTMQYTTVPTSSYPGQYGHPPQTAPAAYVSTSGYPPPAATSGVISPTPTYGYSTQTVQGRNTITSVPGYVIVSPKGRGVKVLYA